MKKIYKVANDIKNKNLKTIARNFALAIRKQLASQKDPQIKIWPDARFIEGKPFMEFKFSVIDPVHRTHKANSQYKLMISLLRRLKNKVANIYPNLVINVISIDIPNGKNITL